MTRRQTALVTVENPAFGGSSYNSLSHAKMFKKYGPYSFGVKQAQLYSSELGGHLLNKKFTYLTIAQQNVYMLPPGCKDYEWQLIADADVDFTVTDLLVDPNSQPGKARSKFFIALDRDWLHEPVLIKSESDFAPLVRIIGNPTPIGVNSFKYEAELQTGDDLAFIDVQYLEVGRTFVDASTMIQDEMNGKQAGDQFGDMFKLQSWIGYYGRKATFTDRFLRMEMKNKGSRGKSGSYSVGGKSYMDGAVSKGYVYKQRFNLTSAGKPIKVEAGVFVTNIEARLEERINMDREVAMEFGQLEKTWDYDTDYEITYPPGWRQIVREGHYKDHYGDLNLTDIYEYVSEVFLTRRMHKDRRIYMASGEAGVEYLHRLIAREAQLYNTQDTVFLQKRTDPLGYNENELAFGAQFTKIRFPMGYIVEVIYDPIKDDRKLFKEKIPGTNRNIESFCYDVFDMGKTDARAVDSIRSENITMVMEESYDLFYHVCNVYDFMNGGMSNGEKVAVDSRGCKIVRETSGALCVWDASRIGRMQYRVAA